MVHAAAASMVGLLLVHGGSALCFAPSAPMTGVRGGSSAHCENRLGAPVRARLRGGAALDTVRMADPGESGGGAPTVKREDRVGLWRRREAGRILKLALPALSIPLADPVMSLVDSVCIGRYATTLDLAALGPNVVVFNFVSFVFTSLAITTTIRMSTSLAKEDREEAGRAVSTSAIIAFVVGAFLGTLLFFFPGPALATTGALPEILASAEGYCRVRALAIPAAAPAGILSMNTRDEKC